MRTLLAETGVAEIKNCFVKCSGNLYSDLGRSIALKLRKCISVNINLIDCFQQGSLKTRDISLARSINNELASLIDDCLELVNITRPITKYVAGNALFATHIMSRDFAQNNIKLQILVKSLDQNSY